MLFSSVLSAFGVAGDGRAAVSGASHAGAGAILGGGRPKRRRLRLRRHRDRDRDHDRNHDKRRKKRRSGAPAGGNDSGNDGGNNGGGGTPTGCGTCSGDTLSCLNSACVTCPAACPPPCTACYNGPASTVCAKFTQVSLRECATDADCTPSHPHCAYSVVSSHSNVVIPFETPPSPGKGLCFAVQETCP
jgi:hypothetical protein